MNKNKSETPKIAVVTYGAKFTRDEFGPDSDTFTCIIQYFISQVVVPLSVGH